MAISDESQLVSGGSRTNILVLAPVMSKHLCEDYYVYTRLKKRGANLAFVTWKNLGARANYSPASPYENSDGFPIYRIFNNVCNFSEMGLFPLGKIRRVLSISRSLKPSVILCHLAENMPLATTIQRYLKVPIVLHEEVASKIVNSAFVGRWQTRAVRVLMGQPITGKSYWSWLCQRVDALITSEPHDKAQLESLGAYGKPLYYLPWPARIPETCALPAKRCKFRAIYAGTLLPNKNTQELSWIIPLILEKTETKEFVIVGSGSHERVIEKLKQQFGERIIRIPSLPRCEVLKLIAGSQYAFSPVKEGGWGFLGDCWGTRTPLFMLTNIFQEKILDIAVAKDGADLVEKINRLYNDYGFYQKMQEAGDQLYCLRSADVVGDQLLEILQETIERKGWST